MKRVDMRRWNSFYKKYLDKSSTKLGEDYPETLTSMNNLGFLYECQGRYEEVEPLYKKCLEMRATKLGEDHPDTLESMCNLGASCNNQGRYKEAESLLLRSVWI